MVLKCYYDKYDEISLYIDDKKLEITEKSGQISINDISKGSHVIKIEKNEKNRKIYNYIFRWIFSIIFFVFDGLLLNIENKWLVFVSPIRFEYKLSLYLQDDQPEIEFFIKKSKYSSIQESFTLPQIDVKFQNVQIEEESIVNYADVGSLSWELNKYLSKIFAGIIYFSILVVFMVRLAILNNNLILAVFSLGLEITLLLIFSGICFFQIKKYNCVKHKVEKLAQSN